MGIDDDDIHRHLANHDYVTALEVLVHAYQHAMVRFCTGMLGEEGDDAAQEVFLSAYEAMPRFRRTASVRTWLFAIARNRCRKVLRDRKRRRRSRRQEHEIARQVHRNPLPRLQSEDLGHRVWQFLQELPEKERAIVLMRSRHALSHPEVAKVLGISKRSVQRKWAQALKYLGGRLHETMES